MLRWRLNTFRNSNDGGNEGADVDGRDEAGDEKAAGKARERNGDETFGRGDTFLKTSLSIHL